MCGSMAYHSCHHDDDTDYYSVVLVVHNDGELVQLCCLDKRD